MLIILYEREFFKCENGSDNIIDAAERAAILEKVVKVTEKTSAKPPSAEANINEDTSLASFGTLLEQTVALQEKLKKDTSSADNDLHAEIIKKSKMYLAEDMMKRLIR